MAAAKLSKVDKLRIAGELAPVVRRGNNRKVNVYKRETGETLRQVPLDEVQAGIAKLHEIEFSVPDGDRPQVVACLACKRVFNVLPLFKVPKSCYGGCRCACGKRVNMKTVHAAMRLGVKPACGACSMLKGKGLWRRWGVVAESNGVSQKMFHGRLVRGFSAREAAETPRIAYADRRRPASAWEKWRHVAVAHGVKRYTWYARVSGGMSEDDAATSAVLSATEVAERAREKRWADSPWRRWRDVAEQHGVRRALFAERVREYGWSHDRAASTPPHGRSSAQRAPNGTERHDPTNL